MNPSLPDSGSFPHPAHPDTGEINVEGLLNYLGSTGNAIDAATSLYNNLSHSQIRGFGNSTESTPNLFSSMQVPAQLGLSTNGGGSSESGRETSSVQEKNRRAQKRFRERQKAKMKDMTEQLDEINAELSKLKMENETLRNRNGILEKVLSLRDDQIRLLQDEQHVFDLGKEYFKHSNMLKGQFLVKGVEDTNSIDPVELALDMQSIKSMSPHDILQFWKSLVRDLGSLLVNYDKLSDEDAAREQTMSLICEALDKAGQLCMQTAVLHPTNMQYLISSTLDDGRSGMSPDDKSLWRSVVACMHLSEDQECQVIALRDIFVARMSKILDKRQEILRKLRSVAVPDRLVALQNVISETLRVNEATISLKSSLQEEHLCGMEFIGTVFKTTFTPIQKARAIVQSYPFYPDIYQIATAVAQSRQSRMIGHSATTTTAEEGPSMKLLKS